MKGGFTPLETALPLRAGRLRSPRGGLSLTGFTLIEVIVVIGIFTGILTLVTMFSLDIGDFAVQFQQELFAKQDLELAVSTMTRELRGTSWAANGSYPLVAANATSVTFYADVNADGRADQVQYLIGTSTIERATIAPSGTPATYPTSTKIKAPILSSVTTGTFRFYDDTYTGTEPPLAFPADVSVVRAVRFQVTIDHSTTTRPVPQTAMFTIVFRNLKQ